MDAPTEELRRKHIETLEVLQRFADENEALKAAAKTGGGGGGADPAALARLDAVAAEASCAAATARGQFEEERDARKKAELRLRTERSKRGAARRPSGDWRCSTLREDAVCVPTPPKISRDGPRLSAEFRKTAARRKRRAISRGWRCRRRGPRRGVPRGYSEGESGGGGAEKRDGTAQADGAADAVKAEAAADKARAAATYAAAARTAAVRLGTAERKLEEAEAGRPARTFL